MSSGSGKRSIVAPDIYDVALQATHTSWQWHPSTIHLGCDEMAGGGVMHLFRATASCVESLTVVKDNIFRSPPRLQLRESTLLRKKQGGVI